MSRRHSSNSMTRRNFLGILGTGAAAICVPAAVRFNSAQAAEAAPAARRFVISEDRFGRIFPQLPPFATASDQLSAALLEIGKPGGILDAKDNLAAGAAALIVDPALNLNNPNNPQHTAGTTFVGQFIDHDLTFDLTSRLGVPTAPELSPNLRDPAFDLDSVYGGGPLADPNLYEPAGRGRHATKFKVESGGLFEDLPRANGTAIIADPRNDENLIIAGLQVAFLLFHNKVVDLLAANAIKPPDNNRDRGDPAVLFNRARKLTTWHYQWMVLREFLPLFIGQALVDDILNNGRKFYRPRVTQIPVEFQGAVYRFGHSMVRPSYRANFTSMPGNQPFFAILFDPAQINQPDPDDLRGGFRAPRRFIGWPTFFDFGDGNVRPNKLIDAKLSSPLFDLPLATIASGDPPTSLAQRNLLRHVTWQLPSGQAIAKAMNLPALSADDLAELKEFGQNLQASTPLWHYILKEAQIAEKGLRLGPVGGRIVGEVIIGLLQLDRDSFLAEEPGWRPTLPTRGGQVTGDFKMIDFLTFAGVAGLR